MLRTQKKFTTFITTRHRTSCEWWKYNCESITLWVLNKLSWAVDRTPGSGLKFF